MNNRRKLLPTLAFLMTAALATSAGASPIDCAKPSGHEQVRACRAANDGVAALRQFLQRTRGIYVLSITQFGPPAAITVASVDDRTARRS